MNTQGKLYEAEGTFLSQSDVEKVLGTRPDTFSGRMEYDSFLSALADNSEEGEALRQKYNVSTYKKSIKIEKHAGYSPKTFVIEESGTKVRDRDYPFLVYYIKNDINNG